MKLTLPKVLTRKPLVVSAAALLLYALVGFYRLQDPKCSGCPLAP